MMEKINEVHIDKKCGLYIVNSRGNWAVLAEKHANSIKKEERNGTNPKIQSFRIKVSALNGADTRIKTAD
ncbi:MAG: hypothetical protein PWQ50_59 [Methanolobus sp.]|jgi:hypothetical protein|nr:hypothetical protein [Methanolobus sp.]